MKPILFALIALVIYSFQNTLMEQKLSNFNSSVLLLHAYLVMLPLAIGQTLYLKATGQLQEFPSGVYFWFIIASGVMWYCADFFYIAAFTHKGAAVAIASIMIMLPIGIATIKKFWVGADFNRYHVVGYIFAVIAIFLIAKAEMIAAAARQTPAK